MAEHNMLVRPLIAALPVHLPQKFTYDWFLRIIGDVSLKGKRIFDFGPGGYPFDAVLARLGATVTWWDRNPQCEDQMAKLAKQYGVVYAKRKSLNGGDVDIIVASNSVQHNHTGAEAIFRVFDKMLAPGGMVLISEKLSQRESYWVADRPDPCWTRNLADHHALWNGCGFTPAREAFFDYNWAPNPTDEHGYWTSADRGCQVLAQLVRTE